MFKNFLITTLRSFKKHKSYTMLNVFGLALGIGCALVIYNVVTYELSYDTFHENYRHIYRVISAHQRPDKINKDAGMPHPIGDALRSEYAFIDEVVKIHAQPGSVIASYQGDLEIKRLNEEGGLVFVNPSFFRVFTFTSVSGDLAKGVEELNSAVISDEWVRKYFDLTDAQLEQAIGKTLTINSKLKVTIKGIFQAPPQNSDFPFHLIVHYHNLKDVGEYYFEGKEWNSTSNNTNCYLLIKNEADRQQMVASFRGLVTKHWGEEKAEQISFDLQPLSDVHFNGDYQHYGKKIMDKRLLMALALVGIFLIITACINFTNLATAQAVSRSKEIGVRKVMGSHRGQLRLQFYAETFLITCIGTILSLPIAELSMVWLQDILGYRLSLNFSGSLHLLFFLVVLVLVVTLLAGFYPSLVLSRMNPVLAIKNKITSGRHSGGLSLRKTLVVAQFAISQAMVIGTIVVLMQILFIQKQPLGFNKEAILTIPIPLLDNPQQLITLRSRAMAINGVENVTLAIGAPLAGNNSYSNFSYPDGGVTEDYHANFKSVDENYLSFYGLELLAGRNIRPSDSTRAVVINEQVMHIMGVHAPEEAIGKKLKTGFNGDKEVVGVMKNFHIHSLHSEINPAMIVYSPSGFYEMGVKLSTAGNVVANIDHITAELDKMWSATFKDFIFDYSFLDEDIEQRYTTEKNLGRLFLIFSGIALFIGGLGLYGLISFMANRRIKEIGVRKVLGAGVGEVLYLLTREIIVLLAVAFVLAAPFMYWVMSGWLSDFVYHTPFSISVFVAALGVSFIIALVSAGYRAFLAANANPVESLRSE